MFEVKATYQLGEYQTAVNAALKNMADAEITARIWDRDHTVWQEDPAEITNRLGWLDIATRMKDSIPQMTALKDSVEAEGYTDVLLLGMGGSSLAPEVFSRVFSPYEDGLRLQVLDSTDPGAVSAYADQLDPATTLYIVATKSGGTVETLSFFKYFYNRAVDALGAEAAGRHFVAITDAGSNLDRLADEYHFRETFRNDPNIGGRYSALSFFGMVAATLVGVDAERYLDGGAAMAQTCRAAGNPGALLGSILGVLAASGRDKLTFIASPGIAPFADWAEQLIAESTGKNGKGIVPVVGESVGSPRVYGDDRLFVYLRLAEDTTYDGQVAALADAGHPVVSYHLADRYELAGQMFLWEFATAVAGHHLGIHPFNQPNVEAAKVAAREMVDAYTREGKLPESTSALEDGHLKVYGDVTADTPDAALKAFLDQAEQGDYFSIQAYVQPTDGTEDLLRQMQTRLRDKTKRATTFGYGPRFLHSTGQLHKGDDGSGLFIQFTSQPDEDLPIPDTAGSEESSMKFGVLKLAQAMGDRQALLDAGRRVIRFDLSGDVLDGLERLLKAL